MFREVAYMDALARFVGAFLYGANSYILLIGSNQMLIALAYGLAPLAFACLLDAVDNSTDRLRSRVPTAVTCGLWLALVATLDTGVQPKRGAGTSDSTSPSHPVQTRLAPSDPEYSAAI